MNLSSRFSEFSSDIQSVLSQARAIGDRRRQRGVVVGGCVRDLLLNVPTGDVDLMFEAPAAPVVEAIAAACNATFVSHARFLTHTIKGNSGWKVDVVTARTETYPKKAQLPEVTSATIEEDFRRRDFTVNAIACWITGPQAGDVLDPLNGAADVSAKLIRALHPQSFQDDPTRIYRAARFAGRFGFTIETQTQEWIAASIKEQGPAALSPVRRRHEFEIILREPNPSAALALLQSWGALAFLHPGWEKSEKMKFDLSCGVVLEDRLVQWFGQWDKDTANQMMTDLSFEKTVKLAVLSKLVQSRTRS